MTGVRVLALTSYPTTAAATRFRLVQMARPLAEHGITLDVRPFLSEAAFATLYDRRALLRSLAGVAIGLARRARDAARLHRYDAILVQREAMIVGPPFVERLVIRRGLPLVLDLDDPTWVDYDSPTYGTLGRALKSPGKAERLIDMATVVVCGSPAIAAFVRARGREAVIMPTVVDTDVFKPRSPQAGTDVTVGWIGSHSTYPYVADILPALEQARSVHPFRLLLVGAPKHSVPIADWIEVRPWRLEREVDDFREVDVGLYPLSADEWSVGKSGFKAIQYLAVGVPFVVTPVGATRGIGRAGSTHIEASSPAEWVHSVSCLVGDPATRRAMGAAGREWAIEHYGVPEAAAALAGAIKRAVG